MALTIQLTPETEEKLREKAAREGLDPETIAAVVLTDALDWEAQEIREAISGIQRGFDDFSSGRYRSFADFAAEQGSKHHL